VELLLGICCCALLYVNIKTPHVPMLWVQLWGEMWQVLWVWPHSEHQREGVCVQVLCAPGGSRCARAVHLLPRQVGGALGVMQGKKVAHACLGG
jgi:hypothetical protein